LSGIIGLPGEKRFDVAAGEIDDRADSHVHS
jgi:hypothetical protein